MSKFRIQRYKTSVTIVAGTETIKDACSASLGLNGLLRQLVIVPPAAITGASWQLDLLDSDGTPYYTKSSNAANTNLLLPADPAAAGFVVPVCVNQSANWLQVSVPADNPAQGTLTSANAGGADVSNNDTVTIGLIAGGSKVYTFKTNLTEAFATATITDGNASNVSDNDTVTINGRVYRFKTVIVQINDIFIGASADASLTNLVSAINGAGTPGTDYFTGTTVNADVSASAVGSNATTLTAKVLGTAGNSITIVKSATTLTLGNTTGGHLNGGVNSVANEVKISGTADGSLTNLKKAINGEATAGTNYSTATIAHPDVSSAATASHHIVITANVETIGGNSIVTTTTAATLSWGAATLVGSGEAADRLFTIYAYIER